MVKYFRLVIPILFLILVFTFAIFGDVIYIKSNPNVRETTVKMAVIDGNEKIVIPKTAYTGESVFITVDKEGFMITHKILKEVPVSVSQISSDSENYIVINGVKVGDRIVDKVKSSYKDGQIVILL